MKYDFTSVIDRYGRDALAVEALGQSGYPAAPKAGFDAIPMWVADMNFPCKKGPPIPSTAIFRHPRPTITPSSAGIRPATA